MVETQETNIVQDTESIELNLTAKGLYQWTIKVRAKELNSEALTRLSNIESSLKNMYPNNTMVVQK